MNEFFTKCLNNLTAAFSSPQNIVFSVLDIIATFLIVYGLILFFRRNNALGAIKFIVAAIILAIFIAKDIIVMPVVGKIASNILVIFILALFVLFTDDTKRVLRKLYGAKDDQQSYNVKYECSDEELRIAIGDIVKAVQSMSKKNTGALIIIAPENIPEQIVESGTHLDAVLSNQLIECIFNNKAPLHDGAVFIRGNKILAAGCFLPLTQNTELDKELGTRHRAAIGETEQYNNHLAIIVSEETGVISVAKAGEILRYYDSVMLTDVLEQTYGLKAGISRNKKRRK